MWVQAPGQVKPGSENVADQVQQKSAKFPEKNPGSFCVKSDKILQESGKASGKKNPGRLDTKPSQVQQGSREGSRKGSGKDYGSVWC